MFLLAASLAGRVVGVVHCLYQHSCWSIGDYCYLEDLFVASDARGRGVGAAQTGREDRVRCPVRGIYITKEDNVPVRALYDKLADRSGFIQSRKLF